ncbi:MAG TPA: serine--tRNA ligase [Rhabdochlamydiaceae bacterium]|nr:serine--tRNA ligase [Rhabdochlamydiaceae bacterium]
MLDIKLLRKEPERIQAKLKTKDPKADVFGLLELDEEIRKLKVQVEELKSTRNHFSKEIGEKKRQGQDASDLLKKVGHFHEDIAKLDHLLAEKEKEFENQMATLPNIPMDDVKVSQDPKENVCIKTFGEKIAFSFPIKNHVELNEKLHLFDFKRAAKISGSHWNAYQGKGALLEWALLNYMIDIHVENGFKFWLPPLLVRPEIVKGSANLIPKFENQLFKVQDADYELYLIPTSEAALMGLHYDEIMSSDELPFKYAAYTPCFRREAGGLGAQERGLIRMHQFNKVEMFAFTLPDQSAALFEEMLASAEEILQGLNMHYRVMNLVTGDMSFAASKTLDVEVYLPGQNRYYEVSSISHCSDFQARRSNTRYKVKEEKPEFVHTLNGSGLATSRLMVALLENNQQEDGSVKIPLVLHKYLGGMKELRPST